MDTSNYVAKLNELAQRRRWELKYEDVCSEGPDHIKTFTQRAVLNGQPYPNGVGKNKKEAKQIAAKNALEGLLDSAPEPSQQTEVTPPSVPPSSAPPTGITQYNYMCWLNEYGQKNRVSIKAVESHTLTMPCCRFVVGDVEYPTAKGATRKEAKEEAAKLVHHEMFGSKTTEPDDSRSDPPKEDVIGKNSVTTPHRPSTSVTTEDEGFADTNFIGILNHYCQKKGLFIDYVAEERTGPSHDPKFSYKVVINKKDYPLAEGKNIKEAKQKAAQLAWSSLQEQTDWDSKVSIRSSEDSSARVHTHPSSNIAARDVSLNDRAQPDSTGDSVVFSDMVNPPKHLAQTPEVKPKRKIAANFLNVCKSKEDIMPNLDIKKDKPAEKTSPVNSRFLSEYDTIEPLGKGAFGKVFKAREKLIDKCFAIKIIRCKEKALREVRALSDLSHENIVRYYTCWTEDTEYQWESSADSYSSSQSTGSSTATKFLYIQMELCDTKTLRVWIDEKNTQNVKKSRRDARRREDSLTIAQQLIAGVEYIHSKSLIHRDLKPANILFGRHEKVKIGDFGLVTDESNDEENLIERTVYRGTPSYMAPEQKSRKIYDRKVDIFALGLIYFELLWNITTGQERQVIWDELRLQKLPDDFARYFQQEGLIIKSMLSELPQDRPEASQVKLKLNESTQLLEMIKSMRTI